MAEDFTIEEATEATPELAQIFAALMPQLSTSARPPTIGELDDIVRSDSSTMFIARDQLDPANPVVGTLTLVTFRIPTGIRAWIEDVIVDGRARGRGIGEALVEAAIERASIHGVVSIDLTSRPTRAAANRLYERLGFKLRDTNVFRYRIGDERVV